MKKLVATLGLIGAVTAAAPASAQLGGITGALSKAKQAKDTIDAVIFTDAEEHDLGTKVSDMLRAKYGVVQDTAVHKYVALVGNVLAQASSRPNLTWTFIVLDTDGVNAFAAPGGFVHVTRGALALMQNESELAGVLGHEMIHVTAKHTINSIRKNKTIEGAANMSGMALVQAFATKTYEILLENGYDRGDETDSDKNGVILANKAGYAPAGLSAFLTHLSERNKDLKDKSGFFASHPETKARLDAIAKVVNAEKLMAAATVAPRFHQAITYKPVAVGQLATVAASAAGQPAEAKAPAKSKFGLGGLNPLGGDKSSTNTVASAGSRGVNPDRDAKGGPNSALVSITVSAAEIADFKKGIS